MFITVKFGDNKRQIFNPNCKNLTLLESIKDKCHCHYEDTVTLSDEAGIVKNIHKNLADYGTQYFKDRECLILLRIEKDSIEDERTIYIPLLEGYEKNEDFLAKLNPNPKPTTNSRLKVKRNSNTNDPNEDGRRSSTHRRSSYAKIKTPSQNQRRSSKNLNPNLLKK